MSTVLRVGATPSAAGLLLRPWEPGDAGALARAYRDPAMRHWLTDHIDGVGTRSGGWRRSGPAGRAASG